MADVHRQVHELTVQTAAAPRRRRESEGQQRGCAQRLVCAYRCASTSMYEHAGGVLGSVCMYEDLPAPRQVINPHRVGSSARTTCHLAC